MIKMTQKTSSKTVKKQNNYETFQFIWAVSLIKKAIKDRTHPSENCAKSIIREEIYSCITQHNHCKQHCKMCSQSPAWHQITEEDQDQRQEPGSASPIFSLTVLVRRFHGCVFSARGAHAGTQTPEQQPIQRSKTLDELR